MSHLFALFLVTSLANILTPGLGVAIIVLMAAEYGWRRMFWGSLGVALGITVLFTLALSGVGVVVATSPTLFAAIKLAGALFIFYMAWQTWRKPVVDFGRLERNRTSAAGSPVANAAPDTSTSAALGENEKENAVMDPSHPSHSSSGRAVDFGFGLFGKCFVISLTNPQPIVFGISVLPQFIDPELPYVEQSALMIATYTVLVFVVMEIYAMAASRARVFLMKGKGPLIMKRVSAGVFVLIGCAVLVSTVNGLMAA